MSEFTSIECMTFGNDGSVRAEIVYTHDMLDKMAALLSQEVDEELMKRIAPKFGYVKEGLDGESEVLADALGDLEVEYADLLSENDKLKELAKDIYDAFLVLIDDYEESESEFLIDHALSGELLRFHKRCDEMRNAFNARLYELGIEVEK